MWQAVWQPVHTTVWTGEDKTLTLWPRQNAVRGPAPAATLAVLSTIGATSLVGRGVRKELDGRDAQDDQPEAYHRGQIKLLAKDSIPDGRDEDDAKARPERIDDPHGHEAQCQGHEVKADPVSDHHQNRRPKARELLACLHRRGCDGFKGNCDGR